MGTILLRRLASALALLVILAIPLVLAHAETAVDQPAPSQQSGEKVADPSPAGGKQLAPEATPETHNHYFTRDTKTFADGKSLDVNVINGPPTPPPGYERERAPVELPKRLP